MIISSKWKKGFLETFKGGSVEDNWSKIKDKILELRNKFVTKKTFAAKSSWNIKGSIPIDKATRNPISKKHKLHRLWMSSTNSYRDTNRLNYSSASRKVKQLLRKKKNAFEKEIASKLKTHPKLFWSHTRSKLKKLKLALHHSF